MTRTLLIELFTYLTVENGRIIRRERYGMIHCIVLHPTNEADDQCMK